jgi:hypothetical protein
MSENDFECFASTGVNTPETMRQHLQIDPTGRGACVRLPSLIGRPYALSRSKGPFGGYGDPIRLRCGKPAGTTIWVSSSCIAFSLLVNSGNRRSLPIDCGQPDLLHRQVMC